MIEPLTEAELQEHCLKEASNDLDWCRAAALLIPFHAGDTIKHAPTGETWILACDQQDNDVMPAGWPETLAKATHCRLVKAATDEERLSMLRTVSAWRLNHDPDGSRRQRLAAMQLAAQPVPIFDPGPSRYDLAPEEGA